MILYLSLACSLVEEIRMKQLQQFTGVISPGKVTAMSLYVLNWISQVKAIRSKRPDTIWRRLSNFFLKRLIHLKFNTGFIVKSL